MGDECIKFAVFMILLALAACVWGVFIVCILDPLREFFGIDLLARWRKK